MTQFDYDLVVIGSGPAGHSAAIQAAKLHKRVLVVERKAIVGGVCMNIGTIPSKTMREAVLYLSGYREHTLYGESYKVKEKITLADLLFRVEPVVRHEVDVTRHQLLRNGVELEHAEASFVDAHTLKLAFQENSGTRTITTDKVLIAVGTEAARDPRMALDGQLRFLQRRHPATEGPSGIARGHRRRRHRMRVCEYLRRPRGSVTIIEKTPRLLPFVDAEIIEALTYHLRERRVTMRLGEEVDRVELIDDGSGRPRVKINLVSGKQIIADKVLRSTGRSGATSKLNLEAIGVTTDARGRIKVNDVYQSEVPNIYGAGDVIGFPSLASTSREQGRIATCHAFGVEAKHAPELFPYGIYTIPEISFVGKNEEELTDKGVPYEVGKAQYREIARGQIVGDTTGMLKLLFERNTRELLGVHVIGEGAVELVHIGQAVLSLNGKVDYFVETVFNYPTLAECYRNAAFDGINRLQM